VIAIIYTGPISRECLLTYNDTLFNTFRKAVVDQGFLETDNSIREYLVEGKVMVHMSFPYAPCIKTSQPLDFLHTLTIWSHTRLWSFARSLRPDFHLCSPLRRDLSGEIARISPATFLSSSKTAGNH